MSNAALRALFDNCHSLSELWLNVDLLYNEQTLDGEPLAVLCASYLSLQSLYVSSLGVAASALRDIFTYCTNLCRVYICRSAQLTPETITALARNCINLDHLNLVGCSYVTIAGLVEVATHCTSLKGLSLMQMPISDEVLLQLAHNCPGLKSLNMENCEGGPITEAGVRAVAERCTGLTSLSIQGNMAGTLLSTLDPANLKQLYPHIKFNIGRYY